jgi:hypothetical protein
MLFFKEEIGGTSADHVMGFFCEAVELPLA